MHFQVWQWLLAVLAGLIVGFSKTGIPGVGIVVVPILAYAFGGWVSVGIMLPMLIFGDCFAVFWYRRHAQWSRLIHLMPWVIVGIAGGAVFLRIAGKANAHKDAIDLIIGVVVITMLILRQLQERFGDRLSPKSKTGTAATGVSAGFVSTVTNAAGPIVQLYLLAYDMRKEQFMGTIAWYYLIFNAFKVPVYVAVTYLNPRNPMLTGRSLLLDLLVFPFILVGALIGKWLLPRVSQKLFERTVLIFAAIIAVKLIAGYLGLKF